MNFEKKLSKEDFTNVLEKIIYHQDEPISDPVCIPIYYLSQLATNKNVKVCQVGEGADELFGGYLYFHKAPNSKEFHEETVRKLNKLHQYDCLRANKSLAAWGIEGRVPFLDKEFIEVAMRLNPDDKMINSTRMEKSSLLHFF